MLVHLDVLVERERWRFRLGQDLDLGDLDFDLPGRDIRVDILGLAAVDRTEGAEHVFGTQAVRRLVRRWMLGVKHQLHDPRTVAQVDEHQSAVVAAPVHPPGHAHGLAGAIGGQVAGPAVAVGVGLRRRLHRSLSPRITAFGE